MIWLKNRLSAFLMQARSLRDVPLSDIEQLSQNLEAADVVLVEGLTRVSDVIRWVTHSPWTHAALHIGRLDQIDDPALRAVVERHYQGPSNVPLLVESYLNEGTIVQPITVYSHHHLRIARPRGLKPEDASAVVAYAISRLGVPYNVRQIFDLLRFLFPWFILPRRWRSSLFELNPGSNTKTVCSTMVAEAFGRVQYPILPLVKRTDHGRSHFFRRNPKLCTPSDFDYSPYFDIVKYPYFDADANGNYALINWHDAVELDQAEKDFYVTSDKAP